jgi:hypothetical protein
LVDGRTFSTNSLPPSTRAPIKFSQGLSVRDQLHLNAASGALRIGEPDWAYLPKHPAQPRHQVLPDRCPLVTRRRGGSSLPLSPPLKKHVQGGYDRRHENRLEKESGIDGVPEDQLEYPLEKHDQNEEDRGGSYGGSGTTFLV